MIGRWLFLISSTPAALCLLGMALLTLSDVLGRNLFRNPVPGATELTEIGLVAIAFLLYPIFAWRRRHISVDLFDHLQSPLLRRVLDTIGNLLGAAMFAGIGWQLWKHADRLLGYGDVTTYLRLPLGPVVYFMAAASGLTMIAFLPAALRVALGRPAPDDVTKHGGYE